MHARTRKWLLTAVKVFIAVVGLWLVARQVPWHDHVEIVSGAVIRNVEIVRPELTPFQKLLVAVHLQAAPERAPVSVPLAAESGKTPPPGRWAELAGTKAWVLVPEASGSKLELRDLGSVLGAPMLPLLDSQMVSVQGTHEPLVQHGLKYIASTAEPGWLLLAWALLCVPFFATALRWMLLMRPQGINMSYRKCVQLTFVGQFYSTFLPGITSGDLVKIIYTSRMVGSKTKSTVTVLLDRVMGLLSLMFVALVAATVQAPGSPMMRVVALCIFGGFGGLAVLATVYFSRRLRRVLGVERLLGSAKMPEFVRKLDEALHAYRGAWRVLAIGFGIGLVSQLTTPLSAYFAGQAFHMDASVGHYLAYVPLGLLAASVPFTPPQGFGVLDYVIYYFFAKQGTSSAGQAFLLAQAVRFLPVLWNLVGSFWVVTGVYSRKEAGAEESPSQGSMAPSST